MNEGGPSRVGPASAKLAGALLILVALALFPPRFEFLSGIALLLFVLAWLGRVSVKPLLRGLLAALPVILAVAGLALLRPDGWVAFGVVVARSVLCVLTLLILAATTPLPEILRVLRAIKVPALLITTIALMYRYLFLLRDQAQRMNNARRARTFTGGRWFAWRSSASLLGALFARSVTRSEQAYRAMTARGWR